LVSNSWIRGSYKSLTDYYIRHLQKFNGVL
jgi:hypothetical protein